MSEERAPEVEMVVESVRVHMLSDRHVVILKEAAQDRYLPIWIGRWEASAIASQLQGHVPERPMTQDLLATILRETAVRLERIRISALEHETFHARLVLVVDGGQREIDARPSDAIALALRVGAPIYAAASILEVASLGAVDGEEGRAEGSGPGRSGKSPAMSTTAAALEATGETIDPRRLALFREFVNSLGTEGDQRGRGDPGS